MLWHRDRALDPCGVPEIQQHLRSRGEAVRSEVEGGGGTFAFEASSFLYRVDVLHERVRVPKIGEVAGEGMRYLFWSLHECCEVLWCDVRRHVGAFKLRVDVMLGGVSVGIGAGPAVVLDGGMQRLRTISNVVAEPSCVKDDRLLDGLGWFVCGPKGAVFTECCLQTAIDFRRDVGLKAHAFGKIVVGMIGGCGALLVELAVKLVASRRKRIEPG